jgi:hypothetical protein
MELGLYPVLFVIAPQILVTWIIVRNYYDKTKMQVTGKKNSQSIAQQSAQYLKNMQFIQNQMGMYCNVHKEVSKCQKYVDWTNEKDTSLILKATLASTVGVVIFLKIVPVNIIMLLGGIAVFAGNTPVARAASTTLPPVIIKGLKESVDSLREGIAIASSGSEPGVVNVRVSLYENQRWWAGLGWIPHLLSSERPAWSDESGAVQRPSKDAFPLPADSDSPSHDGQKGTWAWADADWRLDLSWTTVDEHGWQFTDHSWGAPTAKAAIGSLTRRRLWVRDMKFKPTVAMTSSDSLSPSAKKEH